MSCSPFAGTLADGQLYGRGVEDDKGPAIACVYAMRGLLTINAGQLAVEEGEVRVYFDIRYPVTASGETVLTRMRAAAAPYGLRVWKRHEMRPVYMDKNSRVIRSLLAAYREQTGDMGEPLVVGGGTYARAMKNIAAFGRPPGKGVHRARGRRASAGGGAAASARNLPRAAPSGLTRLAESNSFSKNVKKLLRKRSASYMMEVVSSYFQKLRQKTGGNQVKRGKKLCSILLAVCMLLCMLPTAAFAAGSG